jgi:hypothetical protein
VSVLAVQARRVTPFDAGIPAVAAGTPAAVALALARRIDTLERDLIALRRLRVEVEQVRPGLVLERIEGWHADAADLYADRARDLRIALAGAEQSLLDAERRLGAEVERARLTQAAGVHGSGATPDRPVTGSAGRW